MLEYWKEDKQKSVKFPMQVCKNPFDGFCPDFNLFYQNKKI